MRLLNPPCESLVNAKSATVRDSSDRWFRLRVVYIDPAEQVRVLKAAGFDDVELFELDGAVVDWTNRRDDNCSESLEDNWIYYLCRRRDL